MAIESLNKEHFISYVSNIFVQINRAVMFKELEKIKHFVSEGIYNNLNNAVETAKNGNYIQFYDEMNVKDVKIITTRDTDDSTQIEVSLTSRYMDFRMRDGKVISGDNKNTIIRNYKMIFSRKKNYREQPRARFCPGCGANIDVNRNGNCSYCGATYNLEDMDWVVVEFETY